MHGLICTYNKPHNQSVQKLLEHLPKGWTVSECDLFCDLLTEIDVDRILDRFKNVGFILIGDVFWPTGQNVCKWAKKNSVKSAFLQHGQWIYIDNKKQLEFYPDVTLVFGTNVANMVSGWPYSKFSQVVVVGSPRYDDIKQVSSDGYVLMSPPVIEEVVHNEPSKKTKTRSLKCLGALTGIDKECDLVIQPHYREARTDWLRNIFPQAKFVDPKRDTIELISKSSCIMTSRSSTSVLDAIACGKQVILMDLPKYGMSFYRRGYFDGFAFESKSKEHLLENISEANKNIDIDVEYIENAKQHIYINGASNRVWEAIKSVF